MKNLLEWPVWRPCPVPPARPWTWFFLHIHPQDWADSSGFDRQEAETPVLEQRWHCQRGPGCDSAISRVFPPRDTIQARPGAGSAPGAAMLRVREDAQRDGAAAWLSTPDGQGDTALGGSFCTAGGKLQTSADALSVPNLGQLAPHADLHRAPWLCRLPCLLSVTLS